MLKEKKIHQSNILNLNRSKFILQNQNVYLTILKYIKINLTTNCFQNLQMSSFLQNTEKDCHSVLVEHKHTEYNIDSIIIRWTRKIISKI